MAYGYNLRMTPLQTLTFYNAIANNGEMLRPRFINAVKEFDREVETFEKEVINQKICSDKTLGEIREILKNVVVRGTGNRMYSKNFSMAGKTGTARTEYNNAEEWRKDRKYISSFAGYFPADNPKYSCIVVIHKPSTKIGIYGADVAGPVFKRIAKKIYTETPLIDELESLEVVDEKIDEQYEFFYKTAQLHKRIMPNVVGLPAMDALALLENMGLKVNMEGTGTVKSQSINKGLKIKPNQIIVLRT
jgi:cell division protein FtsI (penicillin-binding protein 3)